ncbi:hypothetical protein [Methylobacter luteus]|uniref:hypothetical protein n=1 Tax=Methylobacter luteus TaxID=415 RepID=UPI0012DC341A|nr:hypothetical protein [Methylobacter luteus]
MSPAEWALVLPGKAGRFDGALCGHSTVPGRTKEIHVHVNEVADHWEEKKL